MRELGFSELWAKLAKQQFTTFRFARRDKDWAVGEVIKVVYKPRSKDDRSVLGIAKIVSKVTNEYDHWKWEVDGINRIKHLPKNPYKKEWEPNMLGNIITTVEVVADGFSSRQEMVAWFIKTYGKRLNNEPMNKLTLSWQQVWFYMPEQKLHIQKEWVELFDDNDMKLMITQVEPDKSHIIFMRG